MAKQTGINAPLYKIDIDSVREYLNTKAKVEDLPKLLVEEYNKQKKQQVYISKGNTTIDGSYMELFLNDLSQPNTSSWVWFFQKANITFGEIKNQLQHLVCFIVVDGELYAFTAGQSAVVFERFIDIYFPIEVGRRIAKPEVKAARANQITGSTLASDLHFRDARRITYTESLDTVWTALSGYMRDEKLALKELTEIFDSKLKIKVDVSSSLRLGPKIEEPAKMVSLVKWLVKQGESALPSDDGWSALDAIKMLNPRKKRILIGKLCSTLAEKVFKSKQYDGLALTHSDIALYGNATHYTVKQGDEVIYDQTSEPTLELILAAAAIDEQDYTNNLSTIAIHSQNEDYGPSFKTDGTLLAHLNGELTYKGKTYFLLTGKWYEVDASYIDLVKKDFLSLTHSLDLDADVVGLRDWKASEDEDSYNKTSLSYGEKINGDKVLTENVELFDTLAYKGEELYILHVKRKFNVKVRDVRSQIIGSAQLIENDLRNDSSLLKQHHKNLVAKGRTAMTEEDFLKLFERRRVYVLAYGSKNKVTAANIGKFKSSVAKMEVVALNNQFRQVSTDDNSATLRMAWVPIATEAAVPLPISAMDSKQADENAPLEVATGS